MSKNRNLIMMNKTSAKGYYEQKEILLMQQVLILFVSSLKIDFVVNNRFKKGIIE